MVSKYINLVNAILQNINSKSSILEELVFQASSSNFLGFVDLGSNLTLENQSLASNALEIYVKGKLSFVFMVKKSK